MDVERVWRIVRDPRVWRLVDLLVELLAAPPVREKLAEIARWAIDLTEPDLDAETKHQAAQQVAIAFDRDLHQFHATAVQARKAQVYWASDGRSPSQGE